MVAKIHIKMLVSTTEERNMEDPWKCDFTSISIILVQFEFLHKKWKKKGREGGEKGGEGQNRRLGSRFHYV